MRVQLDKIASSTRNVGLHRQVVLGNDIPAKAGTVVVVRVLDEKSVYNKIEDVHGRMMSFHKGDLVAGVLGERRALRGYSGDIPERVAPGDVLHLLPLLGGDVLRPIDHAVAGFAHPLLLPAADRDRQPGPDA